MTNVLFIKANDRDAKIAVSVQMYNRFLDVYRVQHPRDDITELDVFAEKLPYYDNKLISAMRALNKFGQTSPESDFVMQYIRQFLAADKIVFAFPLWNMVVPGPLHTYVDYINQAGQTFKYTADGKVGLVPNKSVMLLNAAGDIYSHGPLAKDEMCVNFMTHNLKEFGVTDIRTVIIEGHQVDPSTTAAIIAEGLERVTMAAREF